MVNDVMIDHPTLAPFNPINIKIRKTIIVDRINEVTFISLFEMYKKNVSKLIEKNTA